MTKEGKIKPTLNEAKLKLPPEGQKWIEGLDRRERVATEGILENLGEERFLENWPFYEEQLDELRFDYWRPGSRHRGMAQISVK
jgi:hypothetical protein